MSFDLPVPLLTEAETAAALRVSLTSMRRWRQKGSGPAYRKLGKTVRYRREDVSEFLAAARRTSTSGATGNSSGRAA